MSSRLKEEWPYVALKSPHANATASWEENAEPSPGGVDWMRWGVIGLLVGAAAITVLSGIAVAACHESDMQASGRPERPNVASERVDFDPHLQELLREHRHAVFGS